MHFSLALFLKGVTLLTLIINISGDMLMGESRFPSKKPINIINSTANQPQLLHSLDIVVPRFTRVRPHGSHRCAPAQRTLQTLAGEETTEACGSHPRHLAKFLGLKSSFILHEPVTAHKT